MYVGTMVAVHKFNLKSVSGMSIRTFPLLLAARTFQLNLRWDQNKSGNTLTAITYMIFIKSNFS